MRHARAPLVRASLALHLGSAVVCAASPRSWPWVVGVVLADHMVLVFGSLWPRSSLVGPNLRRLPPAQHDDRTVALTFDDGPDPEVTPRILDRLDTYGAKGSFFCIGRQVERYRGIVKEIAHRGHTVENHSYSHSRAFCFLGPRGMVRDLDRAQKLLELESGTLPRYFRAPAGLRNPWLDAVLVSRELRLVSWTRRGFDKVARDPALIAARLLRGVAPGDILLLHDGSPARDGQGRPVSLEVLPRVLDGLARRDLRSVALPRPEEAASSA